MLVFVFLRVLPNVSWAFGDGEPLRGVAVLCVVALNPKP